MLLCILYESKWLSQFDKEYFEPVELHVSEKNLDEISNEELNVHWIPDFCNNGSRDIVTPTTMCNDNIISRNEKNMSKLVILQSLSVLCYIFRK